MYPLGLISTVLHLYWLWFYGFLDLVFFETGFLCIAVAVLELILQTRQASNSEICLPLLPRVLGLQACATTAWQLWFSVEVSACCKDYFSMYTIDFSINVKWDYTEISFGLKITCPGTRMALNAQFIWFCPVF